MSTDRPPTAEEWSAELVRRTCRTCACFAVIGPNNAELARDADVGPMAQPSCRLNPPQPVQQRVDRPVMGPDRMPLMVKDRETGRSVPRMESVMAWLAIHPPTDPNGKCWHWRPQHVLPGATHWVPERLSPISAHILPPPAGDDVPRGT